MLRFLPLAVLLSAVPATAAPAPTTPPAWASRAIWYQIFVERFRNGDPKNDPTPATMDEGRAIPAGWTTTPWTGDWYASDAWATGLNHNANLGFRRYGGDLQGVLDKLDYLQDLGVTALFFNPLNDAPSLHKYDARHYHHIDVSFGPDPAGDLKLMASESPNDPKTWVWTTADRLFLRLIDEVHKRGMRLILDYSWNHTGTRFWAWQDILKNQAQSPYRDWYAINSFADPAVPGSEFRYQGWANLASLPEIRKVDVVPPRVSGHPYEGQLDPGAKAHILAVTRRWLAPDGDPKRGLDGYRLDVADQIPMGFWREYHTFVKSIKPDAYLVGEIWWETWPGKLMNPAPYLQGDVFDGVMFYQAYRPARAFFAALDQRLTGQQLQDSLQHEWGRLPAAFPAAQLNLSASHDTPRLLSCFDNPGPYKFHASPNENPAYRTGRPSADTYRRVRLYLLHQFTSVGAPHIWNGDELGMWGADDPDCRKPLWWPELAFRPETKPFPQPGQPNAEPVGFDKDHHAYYRQLIRLRHEQPVLSTGSITFLPGPAAHTLAYERRDGPVRVRVFFNMEATPQTFALPAGNWRDLLTGKPVAAKAVLAPLSGVALGVK